MFKKVTHSIVRNKTKQKSKLVKIAKTKKRKENK